VLKIVENLWEVAAPPRTPLGSSQRSQDPLVGGEVVAAPPQEPTPRTRPSAIWSCPLQMKNPAHALGPASQITAGGCCCCCPLPYLCRCANNKTINAAQTTCSHREGSNDRLMTDEAKNRPITNCPTRRTAVVKDKQMKTTKQRNKSITSHDEKFIDIAPTFSINQVY